MSGVGNFSYTVFFSAITISLAGRRGRGREEGRREGGREGGREGRREGGRTRGWKGE